MSLHRRGFFPPVSLTIDRGERHVMDLGGNGIFQDHSVSHSSQSAGNPWAWRCEADHQPSQMKALIFSASHLVVRCSSARQFVNRIPILLLTVCNMSLRRWAFLSRPPRSRMVTAATPSTTQGTWRWWTREVGWSRHLGRHGLHRLSFHSSVAAVPVRLGRLRDKNPPSRRARHFPPLCNVQWFTDHRWWLEGRRFQRAN